MLLSPSADGLFFNSDGLTCSSSKSEKTKRLQRYDYCVVLPSLDPSWSRRMATLPESRSGREIGPKKSFGAICWFP